MRILFVCLLVFGWFSVDAAVFTVSKDGRGAFTTIQSAVDKAGSYDIIEILDAAIYPEQVTIDSSKSHLSLIGATSGSGTRPTILWKDNVNVGPRTCQESLDESKITYDKNGALRLIKTRDVHIQGVNIDGGGNYPFAYEKVWGSVAGTCTGVLYPLFGGNAGLLLSNTSRTWIRDCGITGAYYGVYIKDLDAGGAFKLPDVNVPNPHIGRMDLGNHLIEDCSIHDNSWGLFFSSSTGMGSTIRNNLIFQNHHQPAFAKSIQVMPDGANQPSGAFLFMDNQQSPVAVLNNTFSGNYTVMSGLYKAGLNQLFANNILGAPSPYTSDGFGGSFSQPFQELVPFLMNRSKHNVYSAQIQKPPLDTVHISASQTDSVSGSVFTETRLVPVYHTVRILNSMPGPVAGDLDFPVVIPLATGTVTKSVSIPKVIIPGAAIIGLTQANGFSALDKNRWLETEFQSETLGDSGFLVPKLVSQEFLKDGWPGLGYKDVAGKDAGIGVLPAERRPGPSLFVSAMAPVLVSDGQMVLRFFLQTPVGKPSTGNLPTFAYLRLVRNTPIRPNSFGPEDKLVLPEPEVLQSPPSPLRIGLNEIQVPWPGAAQDSSAYGFVEMAANGPGGLSNIATLPLLPVQPWLKVEALMENSDESILKLSKGNIFRVRVSASHALTNTSSVTLFAASGAPLEFLDSLKVADRDSAGFLLPLPFTLRMRLKEIPESGSELICASAVERGASSQRQVFGISQALAFTDPLMRRDVKQGKHIHGVKDPTRGRNLIGRRVRSEVLH